MTSTFRGVSTQRRSGRWKATANAKIFHSGKAMHLGTFDSEEDAARAWDRMMVWFHLHVVLKQLAGPGSVQTLAGAYTRPLIGSM